MSELNVKNKEIEKLEEIREKCRKIVWKEEQKIKMIDEELRKKRHPFESMADNMRRNEARQLDRAQCDFFDCPEPTAYSATVSIMGELFLVYTCEKHTRIIYEPRHSIVCSSRPPDEGW